MLFNEETDATSMRNFRRNQFVNNQQKSNHISGLNILSPTKTKFVYPTATALSIHKGGSPLPSSETLAISAGQLSTKTMITPFYSESVKVAWQCESKQAFSVFCCSSVFFSSGESPLPLPTVRYFKPICVT